MSVFNIIFGILKILSYILIVLLLVYIIVQVNFVVNNLPIECSGRVNFDPTLNYVASFEFPSFIAKLPNIQTKSISGSISGTKSSSTDGEFTIKFMAHPLDGSAGKQQTFPGQTYKYNKSTCELVPTFDEKINGYLAKYGVEITKIALVPNNGIRVTGKYLGSIPLVITAFQGES